MGGEKEEEEEEEEEEEPSLLDALARKRAAIALGWFGSLEVAAPSLGSFVSAASADPGLASFSARMRSRHARLPRFLPVARKNASAMFLHRRVATG